MIRLDLAPRPVRAGAAGAGVFGALLLAGCSTGAADAGTQDAGSSSDAGATSAEGPYADGTYTAEGTYNTPESVEQITVTLTLQDDVVTDVEVSGDPQRPESERYQSQFIGGIADEVVGRNIDDLSVDRVAGSSLTSGGFNAAVEEIKAEAAA
ncbi:FMN-binding protein [Microbacterium sp. ET2]|uniref:FMN-binding protein n=1 Tax=Microbacterium albipurpureum TaxID=3050384 RepID=UPI00259C72DE|nr:FMN-binding protein [Microbacterium sp. ET2 (Ac-2212)]WJL96025.1 FMN-binding protein [Microbacterium sp. ET2 (Ac-2212)]